MGVHAGSRDGLAYVPTVDIACPGEMWRRGVAWDGMGNEKKPLV